MVNLYPYQLRGVDLIRQAYGKGKKAPVYVAPTGAGKTTIFSYIAAGSSKKGKAVTVLVHRDTLIEQVSERLADFGIPHGIISPDCPMTPDLVQVASVQTLARRLHKFKRPDLIIIDECHHGVAGTWRKVIDHYQTRLLGVTATPQRLDGAGLNDVFDYLIPGPTVNELIDFGQLAAPRMFIPELKYDPADLKRSTRTNDFTIDSLEKAIDRPTITGDSIDWYRRLCPGEPAIAFCVSIDHASHVAQQFVDDGIPAATIHGKMSKAQIRRIIADVQNGSLKMLVSVDLVSEGFDLPALKACFSLRRSDSLTLVLQQFGRVLRSDGGRKKEAFIVDHVGNLTEHGSPRKERAWTLEGIDHAQREASDRGPAVIQCVYCYQAFEPGEYVQPGDRCPYCNESLTAERRKREITVGDGELQEVDDEMIEFEMKRRKIREQAAARDLNSLIELAKKRQYKNPEKWARIIVESHRNKGKTA